MHGHDDYDVEDRAKLKADNKDLRMLIEYLGYDPDILLDEVHKERERLK